MKRGFKQYLGNPKEWALVTELPRLYQAERMERLEHINIRGTGAVFSLDRACEISDIEALM